MKLPALPLLAVATVAFAGCAKAQPAAPPWVSEKIALLQQLGINPTSDFVEAGNYHWSWTSHREVVAGAFHCPPGATVDVSRSIVVVRTNPPEACHRDGGVSADILKVFPDGSAEPLGGGDG